MIVFPSHFVLPIKNRKNRHKCLTVLLNALFYNFYLRIFRLMYCHVIFLYKAFATKWANMWLQLGVYFHMSCPVRWFSKSSLANITFKGLFPCVYSLMLRQFPYIHELLATFCTNAITFIPVNLFHMKIQLVF